MSFMALREHMYTTVEKEYQLITLGAASRKNDDD